MPGVSPVHPTSDRGAGSAAEKPESKAQVAIEFARQAERLGQYHPDQEEQRNSGSTQAVEAKFVTAQDPVVLTANGGRLPAVPVDEALKLNRLKDQLEGRNPDGGAAAHAAGDGTAHDPGHLAYRSLSRQSSEPGAPLREAVPPSRTNPLFPPLPTYGPPRLLRKIQCWFFRLTSAVLSLMFLLVIVLGSACTSLPLALEHVRIRLMFKNPDKRRPFFEEEQRRKKKRAEENRAWRKNEGRHRAPTSPSALERDEPAQSRDFIPTEGGPDPLVCDAAYYARRVGLEMETFDVETEDGFIIELWHVYNPREYTAPSTPAHGPRGPEVFTTTSSDPEFGEAGRAFPPGAKKYPVLLIHGLLQSAGAYCCTEEDSLAFYLAKSGYDVWLGNNRCGFKPRHTMLEYSDPRMWAWNIRQMGVLDLPALISRVLAETGFEKLGLVAHSQGTTQTLVALAKEQRPEIGHKISVFCALAPAAYAGPLIGKIYLKFMRVINPGLFRCIFGIHAFIPFMMKMHRTLPGKLYGAMGYRVFSFLFDWSDSRWELDLRDRMFQFAPVYVSAESMRWWLGRECFAKQKCILATREEGLMEDQEDEEEDETIRRYYDGGATDTEQALRRSSSRSSSRGINGPEAAPTNDRKVERGQYAWYDEQFPPLALWVAGADDLVDGRRLLRRFDRGREPHVNVVHKKIIEGYEHLDVIWAMDSIEKVGREVKEVIWKTAPRAARDACRVPAGCEHVAILDTHRRNRPYVEKKAPFNLAADVEKANRRGTAGPVSPTQIDSTVGEWSEKIRHDAREFGAQQRTQDFAGAATEK